MVKTKTILIVDDEDRTRQGLKKTLEIWAEDRFEIYSGANGSEALEICRKRRVDLLISDIQMPEMSGLQLLEALREISQEPVVIIISSYSEFEYAQRAIELGVKNYLLKPISKKRLIEAVEQAMKVVQSQERAGFIDKVVDKSLIEVNTEDTASTPIKEAMAYIQENINGQLSLRDVASHVHLNPSYFSALFKERTNLTFSEYVTRKKLQNAKKMLLTTNLSIEEVAEKVGYQTGKYFIKLFKDYEGTTPSKFRKTASSHSI